MEHKAIVGRVFFDKTGYSARFNAYSGNGVSRTGRWEWCIVSTGPARDGNYCFSTFLSDRPFKDVCAYLAAFHKVQSIVLIEGHPDHAKQVTYA